MKDLPPPPQNAKFQDPATDGRYVVKVPELPGCMADGETYEEAITNAQEVMEEWIETALSLGGEIPLPKGRLVYD